MEDSNDVQKRILLNYILAKLFTQEIDLDSELQRIEQNKIDNDPFQPKVEVKQEPTYDGPRPLNFLKKHDGERFKALKNKALKRAEALKEEVIEDAETRSNE